MCNKYDALFVLFTELDELVYVKCFIWILVIPYEGDDIPQIIELA